MAIFTERQISVLNLRKSLKQVEVAKALGISQSAVSQAEKNAIATYKQAVEVVELYENNGLLRYAKVSEDPIENAHVVLRHVCLPYMASGSFAQWLLTSYQYFAVENPVVLRIPTEDLEKWNGFYGSKIVPMREKEFEDLFSQASFCEGITVAPVAAIIVDCIIQGRGREAAAMVICKYAKIDFRLLVELARRHDVLDSVSYIIHGIHSITGNLGVKTFTETIVRIFPKPKRSYPEYDLIKVVYDNSEYLVAKG